MTPSAPAWGLAESQAAKTSGRPATNRRRVRRMGLRRLTLSSRHYARQRLGVQSDHQHVTRGEGSEQREHQEMDEACAVVAARERRQRLELHWLVDGKAREHHAHRENKRGRIRETLESIVEALRGWVFSQPHVVRECFERVARISWR